MLPSQHSQPRRMLRMRLPSTRVQPASSCAARVESTVLVPTLHALGHKPSHLWQKMLQGQRLECKPGTEPPPSTATPPGWGSPPAFIPGVAGGALREALLLVDDELGGVAWVVRDLAQAGTVLGRDAAPALVLIGAGWAGGQAVPIEVEVTAGHAGAAVTGPPAAPQALSMAAFARRRACRARPAWAHCREVTLAVGKGDCMVWMGRGPVADRLCGGQGERVGGWRGRWRDEWVKRWMEGWVGGWVDRGMGGWADGWTQGWMDGGMGGGMGGWREGWLGWYLDRAMDGGMASHMGGWTGG